MRSPSDVGSSVILVSVLAALVPVRSLQVLRSDLKFSESSLILDLSSRNLLAGFLAFSSLPL